MALTYYVSSTGNDSNTAAQAQSIATPWKTPEKAYSVAVAGDTVYFRGGTYPRTTTILLDGRSGSAGNLIKLWAYPGELPVFDYSGTPITATIFGLRIQNMSYVHIKGLRVTGITQVTGTYNYGIMLRTTVNNCIIENCEVDHIGGDGLNIGDNCNNNLVLNCDSHHNQDPLSGVPYDGSNGFSFTGQSTGGNNTFRNCRSWWNCDDGFDTFGTSVTAIFDGCWSFWNGYIPGTYTTAGNGMGFKLGPRGVAGVTTANLRTYTNCLSFENRSGGFDKSDQDDTSSFEVTLYNTTTYGNGRKPDGTIVTSAANGIYLANYSAVNTLKNNLGYQNGNGSNGNQGFINSQSVQASNSWLGGVTVSDADFLSVSSAGSDGARQANGSLPVLNFMKLAGGSDLIDKGVNVGLPFNGAAPDMGCFESGAVVNNAPTADAGVNQTITLPTNTATLTGTGTDSDGTIASYAWTKAAGPGSGSITSPSAASTGLTALVAGTYTFQLVVTDNLGATGTDTMTLTVNPAANQAPIANAGSNQTITLPTSSVNLVGSGTDSDGTISAYAWTKTAGPVTFTITSPAAASTSVTGLVAGTYVFQLKVTDNGGATGTSNVTIVVNPAPNQPPIANSGGNKAITLPTNSVTLNGSGTDADGTITAYAWTKTSGPVTFTIVSPTSATTVINNLVAGTYTFQLQVTDNLGATAVNSATVVVNPSIPPNQPPIANAGVDKNITLPTNTVTLGGSATDADGTIAGYAWVKTAGPATFTIVSPTSASTVINNLVAGTYVFQLTATDNLGATGSDTASVIVNPAPNQLPVANAGVDKTITLPTNSVSVTGSGTDADGIIVGYLWSKISGPATFSIVTPSASTTTINNLVAGTYVFQLQVTDNVGGTATDTMTLLVNPAANQAPVAHAGGNQVITLPVNSATLDGGASTDPDGTVVGYAWSQLSGPSTAVIGAPGSVSTTVSSLLQGLYDFQLIVTDNGGLTNADTVSITVNPALPPPNILPVANAGLDKTITLPINNTTLNGTGTDADGTVTAYAWTKLSGPSGTIASPSSASTNLTSLVQGVYVFQLQVTDNSGGFGFDTVQVTVNPVIPVNNPPVPNAGIDQTITLPINSVTLSGSATDSDGTVTTYAWTLVSGPNTPTIVTPASPSTLVNNLIAGTYVFQLKVTDNSGATATDTIQVIVNPLVTPPTLTIQAEAYSSKSNSPRVEATSDTGGGSDVAFTAQNSWTNYTINVPSTGSYRIDFRVAALNTGAQFQFRKKSSFFYSTIVSVTVPTTGGYQSWQTISVTVNLTAGQATYRIYSIKSVPFSLNYFSLTKL